MTVCETIHAIKLHLRIGDYKPCGKQDTNTLCGLHPAWDTRIPINYFDGEYQKDMCIECYNILHNLEIK